MRRGTLVQFVVAISLGISGIAGALAQTGGMAPATALPSLELSPAQRALIFTSVSSDTSMSTAAPPNFMPRLGLIVPSGVETKSMPDTLTQLIPRLREYDVAFVAGKVLILESKSRRIVEAIDR